jgi:hypothetical protein
MLNKNTPKVSIGAAETNDANTNETIQAEVSIIDYNIDYDEETDEVDNAETRLLIKLYVLADKLIDLDTANLVMDELIAHVDACKIPPDIDYINIVYQCTPTGSPLRALFCDLYIHEAGYDWC